LYSLFQKYGKPNNCKYVGKDNKETKIGEPKYIPNGDESQF